MGIFQRELAEGEDSRVTIEDYEWEERWTIFAEWKLKKFYNWWKILKLVPVGEWPMNHFLTKGRFIYNASQKDFSFTLQWVIQRGKKTELCFPDYNSVKGCVELFCMSHHNTLCLKCDNLYKNRMWNALNNRRLEYFLQFLFDSCHVSYHQSLIFCKSSCFFCVMADKFHAERCVI